MRVKISGYPDIIASEFSAFTSADTYQVTTVTTVADVSGSLNNKYFFLPSANDETIYVVWMNVNSAGTDPKIPNTTSLEIAVATNATDATIATEMRSVIGALGDFATAGAGADVEITFATYGRGTLSQDDSENSGTETGFTFTDTTPGKIDVPANTLYKIVGKYWKDNNYIDAGGTGSTKNWRFDSGDITLIVPIYRILEVSE